VSSQANCHLKRRKFALITATHHLQNLAALRANTHHLSKLILSPTYLVSGSRLGLISFFGHGQNVMGGENGDDDVIPSSKVRRLCGVIIAVT